MHFSILIFLLGLLFLTQIHGETATDTNTTTDTTKIISSTRTTTDSSCVYGYIANGFCHCYQYYEGIHCNRLKCEMGASNILQQDDRGSQQCNCFISYYGTRCQYQCKHGVWIFAHHLDAGYCQCIRGWTGSSCDIPHAYSNSYQSYTASIIFLCLAAFLVIACVLCMVNKRRRRSLSNAQSRTEVSSPIRSLDQRQYGSFYEGHDNSGASIEIENAIHPLPLPKYEDALKLPVFVTPTSQSNSMPSVDDIQPPPYAEIQTVASSNVHQAQNHPSIPIQGINVRIITSEEIVPPTIANDHVV